MIFFDETIMDKTIIIVTVKKQITKGEPKNLLYLF